MISSAPRPQKLHLRPGSVYTGTRAYACDGLLVEALIEGDDDHPRINHCKILEVHDVNVGHRRTQFDVGAFLRRCLKRIQREGLILIVDDQIIPVAAASIEVDGVKYRQYCSRLAETGPFRAG